MRYSQIWLIIELPKKYFFKALLNPSPGMRSRYLYVKAPQVNLIISQVYELQFNVSCVFLYFAVFVFLYYFLFIIFILFVFCIFVFSVFVFFYIFQYCIFLDELMAYSNL